MYASEAVGVTTPTMNAHAKLAVLRMANGSKPSVDMGMSGAVSLEPAVEKTAVICASE